MKRLITENRAFNLIELLVLVAFLILITLLLVPNIAQVRARSRRIECLSNQNNVWKHLSLWGLHPTNIWLTNLELTPLTPETFICLEAAKTVSYKPATSLQAMTDTNCNYNFFLGGEQADGDLVVMCDKDGKRDAYVDETTIHWGGNHEGEGGNILKIAGQGMWVSTNDIKNPVFIAAFSTNRLVNFGDGKVFDRLAAGRMQKER